MKKILLLVSVLMAGSVGATTGGLNASGCHESRRAGYHCHDGRSSFAGSAETTRERSSRLKRECKGGVNAGACAGFTR